MGLVQKLMEKCNIFGYGEIREGHYRSPSTLMSAFSKIRIKIHRRDHLRQVGGVSGAAAILRDPRPYTGAALISLLFKRAR